MHWTVHLEGGPRRVNHSAVSINGRIYSFGGYCSGEDYDLRKPMDVHVLDTDTYRWKSLPTPSISDEEVYDETPYQRYGHSAVTYKGKAYMWGGRNDADGASDILHQYNPWYYNNKLYLFGGYNGVTNEHFNQLYQFNPVNNHWTLLHARGRGPEPRRRQCCILCGTKVFLFGGTKPVESSNSVVGFNPPMPMFESPNLLDLSDMFVLDYDPTLKTLSSLVLIEKKLFDSQAQAIVPWDLKLELLSMVKPNRVSGQRGANG